jgi:hypothetical protein
MARGKQSKGKCAYCGHEVAKNGVAKHLSNCAQWKEAVTKAEHKKTGSETLYHLRVQAAGQPQFWLDLEMRGSATLKDLDGYLRAIWLECCGHMSQFSFGGWQGEEISMRRRIADVLELGAKLTHIYDFGTSEAVPLVNSPRLGLCGYTGPAEPPY